MRVRDLATCVSLRATMRAIGGLRREKSQTSTSHTSVTLKPETGSVRVRVVDSCVRLVELNEFHEPCGDEKEMISPARSNKTFFNFVSVDF